MASPHPPDTVSGSNPVGTAMTSAVAETQNALQAGVPRVDVTVQAQQAASVEATKRVACFESSSNEDDHSAYEEKDGEEDEDDGLSAVSTPRINKRAKAKPRGKAPANKTSERATGPARRVLASSATSAPPRKRARSSTITPARGGPTFQGPPVTASQVGRIPSHSIDYSSTVYLIMLSTNEQPIHVHESALLRSPRLADAVFMARSKARRTQNQIINLTEHDHNHEAFRQLVNYLYTDDLTLQANNKNTTGRMKEFFELMSLAKYYDLPGLQKVVVANVARIKLPERVDPAQFLAWSDDMYHEELDHIDGPFTKLFRRVAPETVKRLDESQHDEVAALTGNTGSQSQFSNELLRAVLKALTSEQAAAANVKREARAASAEESLFIGPDEA